MKRALVSGIATLVLLLVSACTDGNVASRRGARPGATVVGNDYNFHVNNIANALMAKNPKMTLKEATAEARQTAAAEASPSSSTWAEDYQRQQKADAKDKFLADLDKSQRSD